MIMAKTESTLDIRKKEWFQQNVKPPPSYNRRRSVSITEKSSEILQKSRSSGAQTKQGRSRGKPSKKDILNSKRNQNVGFTIHFSLDRAMRALRRQEKEIYRPTITPQKIQAPPPKPKVVKRPPVNRKRKPVLKRFVFDHDTKQWKQEVIIDNQGAVTTHTVAVTDMAGSQGTGAESVASFFHGAYSKPNSGLPETHRSQTSLSALSRSSSFSDARPPSILGDQESTLDHPDEYVFFVKENRRPDSTMSASDVSVNAESTDTGSSRSGQYETRSGDDLLSSLLDDHIESNSTANLNDISRLYGATEGALNNIVDEMAEAISEITLESGVEPRVVDIGGAAEASADPRELNPIESAVLQTTEGTAHAQSPVPKTPSVQSPQAEYRLVDVDTKESVGSMRYLTSKGSKVMVRRRSAKKKEPASDSEDTETEKADFPGCTYLYKLANCRAVTNPHTTRHGHDKLQAAGVIEVYTGHMETGMLDIDRVCPYCVVEPHKRINRWLTCMDSSTPARLYTKKDALYYCKVDKRSKAKKARQPPTNLITIPEV